MKSWASAVLILLAVGPALAGAADPVRTDRHGDPLPSGAVARLGCLRFCQPLPVSISFSPDGKVLASGGYDHKVRFWDPDTGKELRTLEGHRGSINGIAFSADGRLLASGSQDNDLRLWDAATGKELRRFEGHRFHIELMALSLDGKVLASSCLAGTLRLWDTGTGKEVRAIPIDKAHRVDALAFSPDGKILAFRSGPEKGIRLVDVASGRLVRKLEGHPGRVDALVFSADGKRLISTSPDKTIRVWDVTTGKEERRYGDERAGVRCLALAPDGKTITYGTYDGMVHILDTAANKEIVKPWKGHQYMIASISYSPDSKRVAVARDTIAIHDVATGKRLNLPPENESRVLQVAYAPDGTLLAVMRQDATVEVWDTATWRKVAALKGETGAFRSIAFSPDGKHLAAAEITPEAEGVQGVIRLWDPRTGKAVRKLPGQGQSVQDLSYSAAGDTLACLVGSEHVILWDPATGKERRRYRDPSRALQALCLSPEGEMLACAGWIQGLDVVCLRDTATWTVVRTFGRSSQHSHPLALSPDGRTVVSTGGAAPRSSAKPDLFLWEAATGQQRLRIPGGDGQLVAVAWSPDGRLLASAAQGETIRVWDALTGKEVGRFAGHRGWMTSLAFAPDGKTLASGGVDSTVLIWDVAGLARVQGGPAARLTPEEWDERWTDLAADDGARAYRASADLIRRPGQAEGVLKERLARKPTASKDGGEKVRLLRVVEVLERIATPEARRLLGTLADGSAGPEVARAAKSAQARLGKRPAVVP